jgi:hypothetical protein
LKNAHGRPALEQFHHDAFMRRVKMLDDDERHAAVLGDVAEEEFQRGLMKNNVIRAVL